MGIVSTAPIPAASTLNASKAKRDRKDLLDRVDRRDLSDRKGPRDLRVPLVPLGLPAQPVPLGPLDPPALPVPPGPLDPPV